MVPPSLLFVFQSYWFHSLSLSGALYLRWKYKYQKPLVKSPFSPPSTAWADGASSFSLFPPSFKRPPLHWKASIALEGKSIGSFRYFVLPNSPNWLANSSVSSPSRRPSAPFPFSSLAFCMSLYDQSEWDFKVRSILFPFFPPSMLPKFEPSASLFLQPPSSALLRPPKTISQNRQFPIFVPEIRKGMLSFLTLFAAFYAFFILSAVVDPKSFHLFQFVSQFRMDVVSPVYQTSHLGIIGFPFGD